MTKEEFVQFQESHRNSGLSLKKYLQREGIGYSTYSYWRHKFQSPSTAEPEVSLAPVSFRSPSCNTLPKDTDKIILCFPNGVRVSLHAGMEECALRLITSYPYSHVLPE